MVPYRIVERPAFTLLGKQTFISGPDNEQFGRFWQQCQADGLMTVFQSLTGFQPGPHTGGTSLGVSRVDADPANRAFFYLIGVECDQNPLPAGLERVTVPACTWAVFECRGKFPDSIVAAEMFAFGEWLPTSGYRHAPAPEMEVYLPEPESAEFWLPIQKG